MVDELFYGHRVRAGDMESRGLKDKGDTQHEEARSYSYHHLHHQIWKFLV